MSQKGEKVYSKDIVYRFTNDWFLHSEHIVLHVHSLIIFFIYLGQIRAKS